MAIADQNADNPHSFRPPHTALPHLTSPSFSPFRTSRTTRAHVKAPSVILRRHGYVGRWHISRGSFRGARAAIGLICFHLYHARSPSPTRVGAGPEPIKATWWREEG